MLQVKSMLRLLLPGWLILWVAASTGQTLAVEPLRFNRDIRPILSDNCFACHGPDRANRKADMRLDQAGDWDNEEFVRRILSDDHDEIMPPPKSQKTLSASQKGLLKRWIADGAKYESHWSFALPIKPTSRNNIDDFIREELPQHG